MNIHTNCSESFCFQCILVLSNVAMQGRRFQGTCQASIQQTHTCNHTNTHTFLQPHKYTHLTFRAPTVCTHTCTHHTHTCTQTHTHIRTYARTHTHTRTNTHMQNRHSYNYRLGIHEADSLSDIIVWMYKHQTHT